MELQGAITIFAVNLKRILKLIDMYIYYLIKSRNLQSDYSVIFLDFLHVNLTIKYKHSFSVTHCVHAGRTKENAAFMQSAITIKNIMGKLEK